MTGLIWGTDWHLNFLPDGMTYEFGVALAKAYPKADRIVISGDIAEAHSVEALLTELEKGFGRPIAFVLGNHDYYYGSIDEVVKEMENLSNPNLIWLDRSDPILLDDQTALVGHQGWYDGRLGDARGSKVLMSDFQLIKDFRHYFNRRTWIHYEGVRESLLEKLDELSSQAAEEARESLKSALVARKVVLFATHYPPFAGACWHEGNLSDKHWTPWFTSARMGEMLAEEAEAHPDNEIIVLCGHTHSSGVYHHLDNLTVLTGQSEYGKPEPVMYFETPIDLKVV